MSDRPVPITPGTAEAPTVVLKTGSISNRLDIPQAMAWVQATYGKGRLRQLAEIAPLSFGPGRMTPRDYYAAALFRPELTPEDRRAYVSDLAGARLNDRLSPNLPLSQHGLFRDKVMATFVLTQAGFPTVPMLALYSTVVEAPATTMLRDVGALARWLQDLPAPVFGKPVDGSLGVGGVAIVGTASEGLLLGDGRVVPADVLAREVARHFARGWMVQPLLRLHPDVAALAGQAAAMLRVTTLRLPGRIETLYTVLRLPAKGAMVDSNTGQSPNGVAFVDESGTILRAQDLWRMNTAPLPHALATGVPLAGYRLPFFTDACRLAESVHRLFPAHGILGFDIALAAEGPVVVEINSNPHHQTFQRSADRGLLNRDFLPRLNAAEAESRRMATASPDRIAGLA